MSEQAATPRNLTILVGRGDLSRAAAALADRTGATVIFNVGDGLDLELAYVAGQQIQRLAESRPIVATTHTPFALEYVEGAELLVCDRHGMCARLSDAPNFAKWYPMFRVCELWPNLGEDWVSTCPQAVPLAEVKRE